MDYRYRFHYGDYAIGENEKLYSDMAAKGWLLCKTGSRLSKFKKGKPQKLKYRIELINPDMFEEREMPPEQLAIYEDCGWQLAANYGLAYVFSAPERRRTSEFYATPQQQAATLKGLRRDYCMSGLITLAAILVIPFFLSSSVLSAMWLMLPEWPMLLAAGLTLGTYTLGYGAYRTMKLHHQLKRDIPIDHQSQNRPTVHLILSRGLSLLCVLFAVLVIISFASRESYELPRQADGPYILLEDMGYQGIRGDYSMTSGDVNIVERHDNIFARVWKASEFLDISDKEYRWMFTSVYQMKNSFALKRAPRLAIKAATFVNDYDRYEERQIEGLDLALYCDNGMEYIAVKGDYVFYITYSAPWAFDESIPYDAEKDPLLAIATSDIG